MMGDLVLTAGRSQSGHVRAARQRPRGDGAPQSLLLGRAAHVLHARARARRADGSRAQGEAGARSDRPADKALVAARCSGVDASRSLDTAKIAQIAGHAGEQTGAVYKITVGRDDLKMTEMGAPINARMGLNTWAAFVGTDDNAAIAGDVAMLPGEVDAGAEGAPAERPRCGRDPSPHARHATDSLLPALLGHRPRGQAGDRVQGRARSTWESEGVEMILRSFSDAVSLDPCINPRVHVGEKRIARETHQRIRWNRKH